MLGSDDQFHTSLNFHSENCEEAEKPTTPDLSGRRVQSNKKINKKRKNDVKLERDKLFTHMTNGDVSSKPFKCIWEGITKNWHNLKTFSWRGINISIYTWFVWKLGRHPLKIPKIRRSCIAYFGEKLRYPLGNYRNLHGNQRGIIIWDYIKGEPAIIFYKGVKLTLEKPNFWNITENA